MEKRVKESLEMSGLNVQEICFFQGKNCMESSAISKSYNAESESFCPLKKFMCSELP